MFEDCRSQKQRDQPLVDSFWRHIVRSHGLWVPESLSIDGNWFASLQACPDLEIYRSRCAWNGSCHWRGWSPRDCAATTGAAGGDSRSGTDSRGTLHECAIILSSNGLISPSSTCITLWLKATDVRVSAESGGGEAVKRRSVVSGISHGEVDLIFGGTAKSAGGHVGWLSLGRGVHCCEREEDVESEEKGVHLRAMLALGRKPRETKKTNTEDSGLYVTVHSQGWNLKRWRLEATCKILTTHTVLGARLRDSTE